MPHKILRLKEVKVRTGLSRSTIYSFMTHGKFPSSIKLGSRAVGWLDGDIDDWISNRILLTREAQNY